MLGADSSRIVRSVGCAALTLLLAATACPTFGAPTARAVESLSAAELSRLPDGALVKLKTGRTVSVGVLRTEHKLRMQGFADAAKLGKEHGASVPATPGVYGGPLTRLPHGTPVPQGTLVPMDFSLTHFNATFVQDKQSLAGDFLAFCKAALATACLYIPSGRPLMFYQSLGVAVDSDVFFGSNPSETPQLCNSLGGTSGTNGTNGPLGLGCSWTYPLTYSLGINSTLHGSNVTQSANCPSPFVYVVDPHSGLVAVSINTKDLGVVPGVMPSFEGLIFSSLQACVVSVFVKK